VGGHAANDGGSSSGIRRRGDSPAGGASRQEKGIARVKKDAGRKHCQDARGTLGTQVAHRLQRGSNDDERSCGQGPSKCPGKGGGGGGWKAKATMHVVGTVCVCWVRGVGMTVRRSVGELMVGQGLGERAGAATVDEGGEVKKEKQCHF
jgi:hypothetical protein